MFVKLKFVNILQLGLDLITGVSRISAPGVYTGFGVWQERVFAPNKRSGHLFGERQLGDNMV